MRARQEFPLRGDCSGKTAGRSRPMASAISLMILRLTMRLFTTMETELGDTPSFLEIERIETPSLSRAILISNGDIFDP